MNQARVGPFLATLLACALFPEYLGATPPLVSANPHKVEAPDAVPLESVASLPEIDLNAYHVSHRRQVETVLSYPSFGKPKIISDDSPGYTTRSVRLWIDRVCEAGEHYEHFDAHLGALAMKGVAIGSQRDFPFQSREVLREIRRSCASDLAPYGVLTRAGTELLWNAEEVQLVGFSWMGALVGLGFDIEGYLEVLAKYRVNLTRVWVVEQWTALAVDEPGAPHARGLTPFAGTWRDRWHLGRPNPAFLRRLQKFVDAAARRGIVVQLTLFDRHGLLNQRQYSHWLGSPYNTRNNHNGFFAPGPPGQAPVEFLTGHAEHRKKMLGWILGALKGRTNVIYEVMNEPMVSEWSERQIMMFHAEVAAVVKGEP